MATIGGIADSSVTYNGCENVATGAVRLLPSQLPPPFNTTCNTDTTNKLLKEMPISWNQTGPQGLPGTPGSNGTNGINGKDGTSVTSAVEPPGANCPNGGTSFQSASGVTYACNGTNGTNGVNGKDGTTLTDVTQLNGVACTTSQGAAGTISVLITSTDQLVLACEPCAAMVTHSTGYNGIIYQDCAPLGVPGSAGTYNFRMAHEAAMAVYNAVGGGGPIQTVLCGVEFQSPYDNLYYQWMWDGSSVPAGTLQTSTDPLNCRGTFVSTWN